MKAVQVLGERDGRRGRMKNSVAVLLVLVMIVLLSSGGLCAEKSDDLIAQVFADRRQEVEKAADDPAKFAEYVNAQKDVNARYKNGETLLHYAANRGYPDIAALLVKKGADINARDNDGRTPLHEAMSYRRYDIARYLIGKGADTNARNKDGDTPLIAIVYMDERKLAADLVTFFIGHGFDVKAPGNVKLLDESIRRGHGEAARTLLEKGVPFDNASLYDAAMAGYDDIFAALLAKGANPSQKGILHAAAGSGNMNIIKTLVEKGAGVTRSDVDIAVFKGRRDAAVYLNQQLKKTRGEEVDLKRACGLEPQDGNCKAFFQKGYYDKKAKKCMTFVYGGCGGTVPFDSVEACRNMCEAVR
jgi:ankyrin repeat protein